MYVVYTPQRLTNFTFRYTSLPPPFSRHLAYHWSNLLFFEYFFLGLECVGQSFAYVALYDF